MADEPSTTLKPQHTVQIVMDNEGHVSVSGPLENKVLMYGLLELAKEVVVAYNTNKAREKAEADARAYATGQTHEPPAPPEPTHQVTRTLPFGRNAS